MSEKELSFKLTCAFCKQDISDSITDDYRKQALSKGEDIDGVVLCNDCLKDHFMLRCDECGSYLVMKQATADSFLNQINAQDGIEFQKKDGTIMSSVDPEFASDIGEFVLSSCPGCGANQDEVGIKGLVLKEHIAALFK